MSIARWRVAAAIGAAMLASTAALAFDPALVPQAKRTKANLYLASEEVTAFLAARGGRTLFVDVRTPAELMYVGSTPLIDANVPLKLGPVLVLADKKPALALEANTNFAADVERRLIAKSLTKSDPVILICRSGDRSAAAADLLTGAGFTQVYSVIDGFEGDLAKDGPGAGHRTVNGWKNKGLPWGYSLDMQKLTVTGTGR
ncbi:MAG: rhodanese-like domain-containing protein [Rhodomicrobium sp.]